jgi:Domain of unknown function (DUF4878)/zinc-ribbon domain
MHCSNCGASVNPGAKFCPNCATPIAANAPYQGGQGYQGGQPVAGPQNYAGGQPYQGGPNYPPGAGYPPPQGAGYPGGYAPPYATGSSNKTAIIIGAIVLVLLIGGGVAAYFLWFNKSSEPAATDNRTTNTAQAQTRAPAAPPGDAVKGYVRALERGDATAMLDLLTDDQIKRLSLDRSNKAMMDAFQQGITKTAEELKKSGGVQKLEVTNEKINGDSATVDFVIKAGAESEKNRSMKLIKEGGRWKINELPSV